MKIVKVSSFMGIYQEFISQLEGKKLLKYLNINFIVLTSINVSSTSLSQHKLK